MTPEETMVKQSALWAWLVFVDTLTLVYPNFVTPEWAMYLADEQERFAVWEEREQQETAKCPYCGRMFYALPQHDPIKLHVQYCEQRPEDDDGPENLVGELLQVADKSDSGFYHKGYTPEQRKVVNTMTQRQSRAMKRSKARGDNAHLTGWIES